MSKTARFLICIETNQRQRERERDRKKIIYEFNF